MSYVSRVCAGDDWWIKIYHVAKNVEHTRTMSTLPVIKWTRTTLLSISWNWITFSIFNVHRMINNSSQRKYNNWTLSGLRNRKTMIFFAFLDPLIIFPWAWDGFPSANCEIPCQTFSTLLMTEGRKISLKWKKVICCPAQWI